MRWGETAKSLSVSVQPRDIDDGAAGSVDTHSLREMGEQGVRRIITALWRHGPQSFDAVGPVRTVGPFQTHLDQMQGRQQLPGLP
ncbi:hypothetical protein AMK30_12465 [Streptomyces sp. CB02460]|nr:hypothetical protein AMK30_12465 [Streptomyces sp. CB02460]